MTASRPTEWRAVDDPHVVYGWRPQSKRAPLQFERGENAALWDRQGRRYVDLGSGQINVNIGYGHPRVREAIQRQAAGLAYVAPYFATEARLELSRRVAERTPGDLDHIFFCNGGSDAIETALKVARAATGRPKILSAWQSYHGATAGASSISGDPRRLMAEPVTPGVARFHTPGQFRSPFGQLSPEQEDEAALAAVEASFQQEGPDRVAAVVVEPIIGTSGLYVLSSTFLRGLRALCDRFGALLIADETMSGWGRSGAWFACDDHGLVPDILTTAKGITSGYVPLGVVALSQRLRDSFLDRPFVGGLTTEGHALACAAALANLDVYEAESLVERSAELGAYALDRLGRMKAAHPSIGDVRGKGLFAAIELTSDRASRAPLAGARPKTATLAEDLFRRLLSLGVIVIAKGDLLFVAPPLTIPRDDLDLALDAVDHVLSRVDTFL
ncbi:aminotransferase class III-fold pyridoxal phosphate-dependent enzyme [Methylopila musalis]|uniref:Aminotransferase class III-fold pyridoxal phosphate-dependent enzyme n=1 Tax=Methylopila musalis TaxID=1134781 RepID=A0ABW3Z3C3_9HYPH